MAASTAPTNLRRGGVSTSPAAIEGGFALRLMILSLLAPALPELKLAASRSKLGSHTCSNLRKPKTCSNLSLEICKRLQSLSQPTWWRRQLRRACGGGSRRAPWMHV